MLGLLGLGCGGCDAELERLQILPLFDRGHHLLEVIRGDVPFAAPTPAVDGILASDVRTGNIQRGGGRGGVLVVELEGLLIRDGARAAGEIGQVGGVSPVGAPLGDGDGRGGRVGLGDGSAAEGLTVP